MYTLKNYYMANIPFLKYLFIYLFIWLRQVFVASCGIFTAACGISVAACGIFSCSMWYL